MTNTQQYSRTALMTCLMRGLHTKFSDHPLIQDRWADRLVTPAERETIVTAMLAMLPEDQRAWLAAMGDRDAILYKIWSEQSLFGGVIIRTRYTEDVLREAAAKGVRQYIIIGAGLDGFGVSPPEFARGVDVFEVDHEASQRLKRDRLAAAGATLPGTLHFVAANLGREELGTALARSTFRFDEPAVMSWLGVTVYLTREANFATLRSIGSFAAAGSELVFTYIERRVLESDNPIMQKARAFASQLGEPWISGFDAEALPGELAGLGLEMVEDVGGVELQERYCRGRTDGLTAGKAGRIARARVKARGK